MLKKTQSKIKGKIDNSTYEKLVIKQMKFEFESLKLESQFHPQAQTIQLITTKMFDDILHVSK
jgi:hypothetical protein